MNERPVLWFRAEHKQDEHRSVVTPALAARLSAAGFTVVVEDSPERAFGIEEFVATGCRIEPAGAWRTAPADVIVIGLKELDVSLGPFIHRHVHFAHVYKYQSGWQALLQAFDTGGGTLYDLEYLTDEQGRRVAAFGYWAGYVGAALALLAWCGQQSDTHPSLGTLQAWSDRDALLAQLRSALETATAVRGANTPGATVIGALGRSGRGAVECLEAAGVEVMAWDQAETASGGPFDALRERALLVNCVFVAEPVAPFTTLAHLSGSKRQLSVISDVSCDPYGKANPLPVYTRCTDMRQPVSRLIEPDVDAPPLDLIAIDHLPSLLPRESSEDFAASLEPTLLAIDRLGEGAWARAADWFETRRQEAILT